MQRLDGSVDNGRLENKFIRTHSYMYFDSTINTLPCSEFSFGFTIKFRNLRAIEFKFEFDGYNRILFNNLNFDKFLEHK